ncbi:ribonuclease HII [Falsibacillus pallidus]|uniref:Ribonuclease HII n=1 Tax=Falsibacillus pallidus TaxID=493781 RepID=A0A370GUW7_9BACI|nr:ribonuclease HII [Falsibacillus pallidus]RDI47477.1 RNase HII [Falsibacillus pallidus]
MEHLSIKEIQKALETIEDPKDPFFLQCAEDSRKGVQQIVQRINRAFKKKKDEMDHFHSMFSYERDIYLQGFEAIAGVDEVGRGPLAGPVVAAAVILPKDCMLIGINDSKKLSEAKRQELFDAISEQATAIGIGVIHADEIDKVNIYQATKKAMLDAIHNLKKLPDYLLIDAMELSVPVPQESIIKGDAKSASIAAASIIAKVTRDRMMKEYDGQYPQYGFARNMGYGTKEHLDGLQIYGQTPIHRKSFAPIKDMI